MTIMPEDTKPNPRRRHETSVILPPLNDVTIRRARDGIIAAQKKPTRHAANDSLVNAERLVHHLPDKRLATKQRREILRFFINLAFKVTIENSENIPTGPSMLAPNHLNHLDPFLMLSAVLDHPFFYVLGDARTMYNRVWKRRFVRLIGGVIPLERRWKEEMAVIEGAKTHPELVELAEEITAKVPDGGSIETLRRIDRIVQAIFANGDSILIFPEGALGLQEGKLRLPLKKGTVLYAMRSGVPIVPVGIIGTRDLFFRKHLTVRFGKPITFTQSDHPKGRDVQAALNQLEDAMVALLPEQYEEPKGIHLFRRRLNRMFL